MNARRMRIVIDLQCCQSGSRLGGIGRYSSDLAKGMIRAAPDAEFIIALNDRHPEAEAEVRRTFSNLLPPSSIRVFSIPAGSGYLKDIGRSASYAELVREQFLRDLKPDVVHVASLFEGLNEEVVTSVDDSADYITAVTLYDLIPLVNKDKYLQDENARDHYLRKFEHLSRADVILSISQFSADEALGLMPDYTGAITSVRGGVDPGFHPQPLTDAEKKAAWARLGITRDFVLYTASFDQRKNQRRLIAAFAALPASIRKAHQLVIVGNGWPKIYDELHEYGRKLKLTNEDILFTGRVSDDDLVLLYNSCKAFVFPSLWEGLGMPPLEAMACGAPTIGSNTTSLPEVLGWSKAMFNPFNVRAISSTMEQALTDEEFRRQLVARGIAHAAQFTWEESGRRAMEAIRLVWDQRREHGGESTAISTRPSPSPDVAGRTDDDPAEVSASGPEGRLAALVANNELDGQGRQRLAYGLARNAWEAVEPARLAPEQKVGWVTTWGTRCGIAEYSRNLTQGFPKPAAIFAPIADVKDDEDGYQVNRCWIVSKDVGLDDLAQAADAAGITDVMIQFNYGFFNFPALNEFVRRQVRAHRRVYIFLHSTTDPVDMAGHRLSDLFPALSLATLVMVHVQKDVERLRQLGHESNVMQVSQGVRLSEPLETSRQLASKTDHAVPMIATYGFFLPPKGLLEAIEAISLMKRNGQVVKLRMVNAEYGIEEIKPLIDTAKERIKKLDLSDQVEMITDFLPDSESLTLLKDADLVVFPYQHSGESSSAAVRMGLATGRPVAVTPLQIFDDVAAATYTLPGFTPAKLAEGFAAVLNEIRQESPRARRVAAAAAAWCQAYDVRHVADHLVRVLSHKAVAGAWERVFSTRLDDVPHRDARMEDGYLVSSSDHGGLMCYGPFISVPKGLYRLIVWGTVDAAGEGESVRIQLTRNFGETVTVFTSSASVSDIVLDEFFRLQDDIEHFEVTISYGDGTSMLLSGYELIRSHDNI